MFTQRIKHCLATIAVLFCNLAVSAHDFEVDGIYYNITSSDDLTVAVRYRGNNYDTYSNEYSEDVVIPSTVSYDSTTYSVTSIGSSAFRNCCGLTSVIIPESVTKIGEYAFCECIGLTNITIPKNVTSIMNYAFDGCKGLKKIVIEDCDEKLSLGYNYDGNNGGSGMWGPAMGEGLFYDCPLEFIYLGRCLSYKTDAVYGYSPFRGKTTLKSIEIGRDVTTIGAYAFSGCRYLSTVTIPEKVSSIGYGAFSDCKEIKSVCMLNSWAITYDESIFHVDVYNNAVLYVPEGSERAYSKSIPWSNFYIESVKAFSITYMVGEKVYKTVTLEVGTEIVLPDAPTKEGYTFVGWEDVPTIMPAEDVEVHASFTPNSYTVTFKANGTIVASESLIYGSTIVAPAAPKVEGYTFVEWAGLLTTVPARDVEFVAVYGENVYMVEEVTLNQNTATITKGETLILTATVTPANATDSSISWSSSNTNVATVDNNGKVTAIASGYATITATANDGSGVSASCEVAVEQPYVDYVTITINQYGSATYSSEYALDFTEVAGLKAYVATGYNYLTGEVTLLRVRAVDGGTGLLVKGTPGVSYEVPVIEFTANRTLNMLVPTLRPNKTSVNGYSDDGKYANYKYTVVKSQSPEPLFYQFEDGSTLSAGKAYLQIPVAWLSATETRVIRYRFDEGEGEDDTTSIDNSEIRNQNSELIYDLMGRRVLEPKKGEMYIIDGRKVIY